MRYVGVRLAYLFSLYLIYFRVGLCEIVTEADFPSLTTSVTAGQWGLRSAALSCDLSFPGVTVFGGMTFISLRFNVRVLDFTHSSAYASSSTTLGSSSQWLVVALDSSFTGAILYSFQFTYGEYLYTEKPTGQCILYSSTNLTDVLAYEESNPDMAINESDRLVSTIGFHTTYITNSGQDWVNVVAMCQPPVSVNLGQYEAYTYVNFQMSVYNVSSSVGTIFVAEDINSRWYLGRFQYHAIGYIDETYSFTVPVNSAPHYESGYCSVYAVTNDSLPGIISSLQGSTTVPTTTSSTTPVVSTSSTTPVVPTSTSTSTSVTSTIVVSSTPTSLTTSESSVPPTTTVPVSYLILENFSHTGDRSIMKEHTEMRNHFVQNITALWTMGDTNQLTCCRRCLADTDCLSVFFTANTKSCYAHVNVYSRGNVEVTYASYYVLV